MGFLYRRGSIWWLRVTVSGDKVSRSTGCSDKKKAEAVLERVLARIEAGENIGDPSAFQGAYDVGGQELWTEKKMAAKPTAEALRAAPPAEEQDILELILGSGLESAAETAPAQPREALSLFPTDISTLQLTN